MTAEPKRVVRAPAVRKPITGIPEDPQRIIFPNGVNLYLFPDRSTEVVRVDLQFDAGIQRETKPLQSQFTSLLLPGGTSTMDAGKIDATFDYYGSFPVFAADRERAFVQLYMLPAFFPNMMPLLRDIVSFPLFPDTELQMQKEGRLQRYLINRQKVSVISLDHFFEALFGSDHPFGKRVVEDHFAAITSDDLKEFHSRNYTGRLQIIALSGNINDEVIRITEECLGGDLFRYCNDNDNLSIPEEPEREGRKLVIEKADALQSSIRIGKRTIGMSHPDFVGLKVVDTILGGYFGSRLMQNLREKRGYTYSVGSHLSSLQKAGIMAISTEVGALHTRDAIKQVYKEIESLRNRRVSARELRLVRPNMLGNIARLFDGPFNKVESFLSVATHGPGTVYYHKLEEKIRSITPDEIKQLASTYYTPDGLHEVVAGSMK
jgi:zinc protease